MIFLSNIMLGIAYVLSSIFQFLYLLMFVYCICSWFRIDPYNPFIRWVNYIADGVLRPIRRFVKPMGQIDLSVLVFFLLLMFLQFALIQNLFDLAQSLRTT